MNDIPEEQNEQPQQYLSPESSGKRLRQAREAAGLSLGEVALHMRLSERKIQALEEDNYDIFPSETFVSGYLRSYAKALGLPEGDFVRPVSSTQLPPSLVSSIGNNRQASSMDLPVRMVTYIIILVIIVSIGMWWVSQRGKEVAAPAEQPMAMQDTIGQAVTEPETVLQPGQQDAEPVAEEAAMDEGGTAATEMTNEETVVVTEPVAEAKPAMSEAVTTAKPAKQDKPAAFDPAMPPMVVAQAANTGNESAAVQAIAEMPALPPLTDEMPHSKLVLEYQDDCWTEVDDSAGRRLVYGLMRAGQTVELRGEAPFKVFLGYAEGVTVYYNNELFEHATFQRGEIARFRVGRAEHNQPGPR